MCYVSIKWISVPKGKFQQDCLIFKKKEKKKIVKQGVIPIFKCYYMELKQEDCQSETSYLVSVSKSNNNNNNNENYHLKHRHCSLELLTEEGKY